MQERWRNAKEELPEEGVPVLAVKQLRNGTRDITLARCLHNYKYFVPETRSYRTGPYWACGGNNNVIYWMPLPEMPDDGPEANKNLR